jgi:hypothetical protein
MKGPVRFLTFTDVHISSINPASRRGNYKADILDKLDQIRRVGIALKVDFFLFGGDLFNLKAPMRNPHDMNGELIDLFKKFPAPIYGTEGNHDLMKDSYETFNEQPIRVIYSSGALIQARDVPLTINGMNVRIRSFPFSEQPDFGSLPKANKEYDLSICLLHLYSSPTGGNLFKTKVTSYPEISELGDDVFMLGHYHIDQKVFKGNFMGKPQWFINVGAIARGVLTEDSMERTPKTAYMEVKLDDEAFMVEKRQEEVQRTREAEEFVKKLREDLENKVESMDTLDDEIKALDLDTAVLGKVQHYLQEADIAMKEIER